MNPTRYILTRSCLQEGSMRLLKFNEFYFPENGTALFVDERGKEYAAQVDRDHMRIEGLGELYHDHNLSVNDVLMITPTAPGRYDVEAVVKPYSSPRARQSSRQRPQSRESQSREPLRGESRESSRGDTPSVRELRGSGSQNSSLTTGRRSGPNGGGGRNLSGLGEERRAADAPAAATLKPIAPAFAPQVPQQGMTLPAPLPAFGRERQQNRVSLPGETPETAQPSEAPTSRQQQQPGVVEDQIAELARLTGYRLTLLGKGLIRLSADLGPTYGYTVLLATEPMATTYPEWDSGDDHRALITAEEDRAPGVPRLTREALVSLIEHARLAPLGALDLRGYWRAGDVNLESAASVAELVSSHLAQRGALTYVLLTLSQQPAQSIVNVSELAQRLGNGVSLDDMQIILDTLSRAPFMALTPLPNGQFLLRSSMNDLLADLADYAQGVRRRLRPISSPEKTPAAVPAEPETK